MSNNSDSINHAATERTVADLRRVAQIVCDHLRNERPSRRVKYDDHTIMIEAETGAELSCRTVRIHAPHFKPEGPDQFPGWPGWWAEIDGGSGSAPNVYLVVPVDETIPVWMVGKWVCAFLSGFFKWGYISGIFTSTWNEFRQKEALNEVRQ